MRNTVRRIYAVYALIIAFIGGLAFMVYGFVVHADTWVTNRVNGHLYTNRQLTNAGAIYDVNGNVLVSSKDGKRKFSTDQAVRMSTLHVVGDTQGFIASGVQTAYRSYLIGYDFVNGVYKTISTGSGNDITLTVDSNICKAAYNAMGSYKGTVAVYNYQTGEIVCCVSKPTYDPENKPYDIDTNKTGKYEGIYLNRFLSGVFTPGSVFKTVTAISALENIPDIQTRTFECTGEYKTDDGKIICASKHGKLTFEQAYNRSCNSVFAELAIELGAKKLTKTAQELGFNDNLKVCGTNTAKSVLSISEANKSELGWAGIGQFTVLANPCNMLMIVGAIANAGEAVTPRIIKNSTSSELAEKVKSFTGAAQIKIDPEIAKTMQKLMRTTIKNYYGDSRFPNLEMCGKTGTAEVDNGRPHSWFIGYSQRSDLPYAIVVTIENGGSSSSMAIPVANKVMQSVLNNCR